LLPAGAVAGWDLHPLERAAFHGAHPTQTLQLLPRRPVHKTTIDAIDELAEKIWDLEGDLLEALWLF